MTNLYPPDLIRGEDMGGRQCFVLVCEHASSAIPPPFGDLGLDQAARHSHIAWDPGALGVACEVRRLLRADLVAGSVSRLLYDCNRPPEAPSAMPSASEIFLIPGNRDLSPQKREARTHAIYRPFHSALKTLLDERGRGVLVTIHSFTPVYHGASRSCEIGILDDDADPRLAEAVMAAVPPDFPFRVERNVPYSAADGVTHTLREHGVSRRWPSVMIEIRNDLIDSAERQVAMGGLLAAVLQQAAATLKSLTHA